MKTVAIVTPAFYKPNFSPEELISLKHSKKFMGGHDKYFLVPDNISIETKKYIKMGYHFVKVPSKYFTDRITYNELLLSESFYQIFSKYKYILIYQLDALVFSSQLIKWCNSGYDYVAAPWFKTIIGTLSHKKGLPASGGNGGFSLRNVQKSLEVLKKVNSQVKRSSNYLLIRKIWFFWAAITSKSHKKWLCAPADNYPFNEDGFWALEAPKYLSNYKVAPFKVALNFAFERFPRKCFDLNERKIPFGCHAWEKYDKEFWLPYIEKQKLENNSS